MNNISKTEVLHDRFAEEIPDGMLDKRVAVLDHTAQQLRELLGKVTGRADFAQQ
jgi:hypothetical protein